MANRAERLMDGDEFLLWCLDQEDRYELIDGFLLVDTKVPAAFLLTQAAGAWTPANIDGLAATNELPAITCRLPMAEVYGSIPFDAET